MDENRSDATREDTQDERPAQRSDWKTVPLPVKRTTISLDRTFSHDEMQRIQKGLIPGEMEDRWFVYWNDGDLYFHRSWTGFCIYVIHFSREEEAHRMIAVDVNRDPDQYSDTNDENDSKMVCYLIDLLLLKRIVIFPSDEPSPQKQALEEAQAAPMNESTEKQIATPEDVYFKSIFYEKLVEHVFISEVLQEAWYRFGKTVEVLRSEVDASGYDLVFDCEGIIRHVQLKTSKADAKASSQKVNIALQDKPSGCVVWIVRHEDLKKCRMTPHFYLYFGKNPREKLGSLDDFETAKHTKGNAQGVKKERPAIRVVPKSKFEKIKDTTELIKRLFGLQNPASQKAIEQVESAADSREAEQQ